MSGAFHQEEADAAFTWLRRVLPQVLARGEELARKGAVKDWEWFGEGVGLSATVHGGEEYQVTIPFVRGRFQASKCECPYESNCKHAAAAMLVAAQAILPQPTAAGPRPAKGALAAPAPAEISRTDELLSLVKERVKTPLPGPATAALGTMGAWWAARKRHVPIGEFLRLCGLQDYWAKGSVTLHAKDTSPRDAWDYLACVDAEVTTRGGKLPAPLPNLIDRARQKELVEAMHREVAEKEWRDRIKGWARSMPESETASRPELRLRLTSTGADLEWKRPGQGEFAKLTTNALKSLSSSGMPSAQEVLLTLGKNVWGASVSFVSADDSLRKAVLELLTLPQFRHVLAGESGAALMVHEEPLRWDLKEEKDGSYALRLVDSAGVAARVALFVAGKGPAWFVTTEAAWPVERWPFDPRTGRHAMTIPAAALESSEGVTVLHRLGLPLPEKIQRKVRSVSAKITVQGRVHQPAEGRSSYVQVRARADYGDHAPCEWWVEHFWIASGKSREASGPSHERDTILYFDKAPLAPAAQWLGSFELKLPPPGNAADAWGERRITKEFPDQFVQWMSARPPDIAVELDAELASLRDGIVSGTVRLSVEEAGMDWFDLRVAMDVADVTLSAEDIQLLLKAQGRWVRIEGKGWRKLEFALTPEQEAELAAMGLAVGEFDGSPQRLHALQLAGGASRAKGLLSAERAEAVQRRVEEIQTRVQPEVPRVITATLRPYQLEGFHFLAYLSRNRFGGVLADDMGLGKTLQALTWIAWLREQEEQEADKSFRAPVLVVCPKSVQDNWRSEVERFYAGLRVVVWTRDDAGSAGLNEDADVVVIHYQQLRQHEEKLSRQSWLAVILDEAQAIKNPSSQSARAACALQAKHRLALSGTPIENRLLDLWSIMGFAMPGVLGNRTHFAKHFDAKADPFARTRLSARVRPFLLRRTKKEVAKDLPDRVEEDLVCELEGTQQKLYQAELKRARAELLKVQTSKQLDKARFNILTSLLRLRQICCHPALVLKERAPDAPKGGGAKKSRGKKGDTGADSRATLDEAAAETGSAKMDALLELLEPIMEEGGKVLVFSQFVQMLELVRAQIVEREWPHFLLTGQTDDRGALVKSFQESAGAAVFLISLKAGGFGLNLTAASYVVLCDPWWNPAVEAQAIDRTHRIGQTQKVNAYRLIVKDTIEEKIRMLQKQKSALAHDILGEENFASALTLDDFRFLLGEG